MEAVILHNHLRDIHDAPSLVLDGDMSERAQQLAKKLIMGGSLSEDMKDSWDGISVAKGCSANKIDMSADRAVWLL